MRLFIGINFDDETRARLIDLREKLRSRSLRGNFTHDKNLHLTLAFIGKVSPLLLIFDRNYASSEMFESLCDTAFLFRIKRRFIYIQLPSIRQ